MAFSPGTPTASLGQGTSLSWNGAPCGGVEKVSDVAGQGQQGLVSLPGPSQYSSKWWAHLFFYLKYEFPSNHSGVEEICHSYSKTRQHFLWTDYTDIYQLLTGVVQSNCSYSQLPLSFLSLFSPGHLPWVWEDQIIMNRSLWFPVLHGKCTITENQSL